MRSRRNFGLILCLGTLAVPALGSYHFNEIQQVIGGVKGNSKAQAIQLRMREVDQDLLHQSQIRAWDAQGKNPIVIILFPADVTNSELGETVLITSTAFNELTTPAAEPDFAITNLIPASYLAAGSLTFENLEGVVLWRVSWGGSNYTGSSMGSMVNDSDGNFGPAFPSGLPTSGLLSLTLLSGPTSPSTSNATDYGLSSGAAVWQNNARKQFTLVDRCPDDPQKATPGSCGCGVPDLDSDGDGKPDCIDPCPGNPADITAEQCAASTTSTPSPPAFNLCGAGTFEAGAGALFTLTLAPTVIRRRR